MSRRPTQRTSKTAGICALFAVVGGSWLVANEADSLGRRSMGASRHAPRVDPIYAMRGRPEQGLEKVSPTVTRTIPSTEESSTTTTAATTTSAPPPASTRPSTKSSLPPELRNAPRYASRPPTTTYRQSQRYPWKEKIVTTIFWIGEKPSGRNRTPNHKSSWDGAWAKNFGGFDDPNPANRTKEYHPKTFKPGQNPFYCALPYNDIAKGNKTKREAAHVIPWFREKFERQGRTVCKGRWIAIRYGNRVCYAQWEDCGPFTTDDWNYVFGKARPKNRENKGAGLDISPAVRDYLGLKSGAKCDWRFCELSEVPVGPWRKFGANNPFVGLGEKQREADLERMKKAREAWMRQQYIP